MAVPTYEEMLRPALEVLAEGSPSPDRDLVEQVADRLKISLADRVMLTPSGQTVLDNRVSGAVTTLLRAGAITRPRRSWTEITDRGLELLSQVEGPMTLQRLEGFGTPNGA